MKCLLIIWFFLFSYPSNIEWRKLSIDDFKGTCDGKGISMSTTEIRLSVYSIGDKIYFKAIASFYPDKSFIANRSEKILQHEQLHFDITELYARKINATLNKNIYDITNYKNAHKIYSNFIDQWNKEQDRYDAETDHSRNLIKQQEWEIKIKEQL